MWTMIFSFLWTNILKKYWSILIILGLLILSFGVVKYYRNKLEFQKTETERYQKNLLNSKFEIDSLRTKNGDYEYQVMSLNLNIEDLSRFNSELVDKLSSANLKIKNLTSIVDIQGNYIICLEDSVDSFGNYISSGFEVLELPDSTFLATYNDKWVNVSEIISLTYINYDKPVLKIRKFEESVLADLNIANELVYKKKAWWKFWQSKKVDGIKTHIITGNPYLKLDKVETYQIIK